MMINAINVLNREIDRLEGNLESQQEDVREKQLEVERSRGRMMKIESDICDLKTAISILKQKGENSVAAAG